MNSIIGWHFQLSPPGWAKELVNSGWVKMIDPPTEDPFPGKKTIGRTYDPDAYTNALIAQGAAGAETWFQKWLPYYRQRPWVHCWESPNEPHPLGQKPFRLALVAFTKHWAGLMHAEGLKIVGLNLSVGWPDIGHAPDLGSALSSCDYVGLHEYGAPTMYDKGPKHQAEGPADDDYYWCLRHRRTVQEWEAAGFTVPPIIITECGIDGGVIWRPKTGWKSYTDEGSHVAQLAWYEQECRRDGVLAVLPFTAAPNPDWLDFEITQSLSENISRYNAVAPVIAPREPSFKIEDIVNTLPTHPAHRYRTRDLTAIDTIIVHHSAVSSDVGAPNIAKFHVHKRDWPGIGYHYVITADGRIQQTNRLTVISYHASGWNTRSIGICLLGNFQKRPPPQRQIQALRWLNQELRQKLGPLQLRPHRAITATACPGTAWAWEGFGG